MHRVIAIAIALSGLALLSQTASAQDPNSRSTPPIQAIPTVEDAPQGTTNYLGEIDPIWTPSWQPLPQPTTFDFATSPLRFSTPSYTSYSTLTFETPITPDNVKLRVNFEPYREGGNFGLGLPLE